MQSPVLTSPVLTSPVLILGASGGVGAAVARRLARDGLPVVLNGRRRAPLEALAAELGPRASVAPADLTDADAVKALVAALPGLAGLVFSVAAPIPRKLTHNLRWADFEGQIAAQLKALHLVAAAAFPLLANRGATSRLILIGTEYTLGAPPLKMAAYVAAKAAATAWAQVAAQEWVSRGVRVHIVAPGLMRSDLTADMPDEFLDGMAAGMPEKRLTTVEDVADMVAFLMTDVADPLYGRPLHVSRAARR